MNKLLFFLGTGFACFIFADARNLLGADPVLVEPWHVTARDAHSRVWESTQVVTDPQTGAMAEQKHQYVELATAMHRWENGAWVDASPLIEVTAGGQALARQSQHQLLFPADIAVDAVTLLAVDGKRFQSRILGLAFYDSVSGQSVLFAELKSSVGQLSPAGTELTYANAFTDVAGMDVVYRNGLARFEQDVVINQKDQFPSPKDYGLPEESTRVLILTEFFAPPTPEIDRQAVQSEIDPVKREAMAEPDLLDEHLNFGAMSMPRGRAFALPDQAGERAALVTKTWRKLDGRDFLVEAITWPEFKALLDKLPGVAAVNRADQAQRLAARRKKIAVPLAQLVASVPQMASAFQRNSAPARIQTAKAEVTRKAAVVLDYTTLATQTNDYVFVADLTFYISGAVNLSGAKNVLEGGAVIKIAPTNNAGITITGSSATLTCLTSPHRTAVLTARDDATVGEAVTTNAVSGYYGNPAIEFNSTIGASPLALHDVRIAYAQVAVKFSDGLRHVVSHAQIVNAQKAFALSYNELLLRNILVVGADTVFSGSAGTVRGEHLTIHPANWLSTTTSPTNTLFLTNSLLISVTNLTAYAGTNNTTNSSDSGVFQTVGGGGHYLTDTYRIAGTANINPGLASDLKQRTTYPPVALSSLATSTNLLSQAPRDTVTFWRGYHYAPLDYFACGVSVASNVMVVVTNGVAIGIDYSTNSWGFILKNAKFISTGDALHMNQIVRAHLVQEKSGGNPYYRACFYDGESSSGSRDCELRLRFTEFSQLANDGYLVYTGANFGALEWTHSRVYNPSLVVDTSGSGTLVCGLTNSFWERGGVQFGPGSTGA